MEKPAAAGYAGGMEFLGAATALAAVSGIYWAFGFPGLIIALVVVTAYWWWEGALRLKPPPRWPAP